MKQCTFGLLALVLALPAAAAELVTGTVGDPAGKPLAGVEVQIVTAGEEAGEAAARTDYEGLFWLEAPAGATLRFTRDGYLPSHEAIDGARELSVRMIPAAELRVSVLAAEGEAPVEGAEALLFAALPGEEEPDPDEDEPLHRVETGADGIALFPPLVPGAYELQVRADGLSGSQMSELFLKGGETAEPAVRLRPVLTVTGSVLDIGGRPIPEARVGSTFYDRDSQQWELADTFAVEEDGTFRLELDRSEVYGNVIAVAPGRAPAYYAKDIPNDEHCMEATFVLGPAAEIRGRVLDADDGPVAGVAVSARVRARPENAPDDAPEDPLEGLFAPRLDLASMLARVQETEPEWRTDETGAFHITSLPAGSVEIQAGDESHYDRPKTHVEIEEGDIREGIVLRWQAGHTARGRVEDSKGQAISGAEIRVEFLHPKGGRRSHEATTDEDGAFAITGIPAAELALIEASADGFAREERSNVPLNGEPLRIRLGPAGTLAGVVYDAETGEPIEAFAIRLEPRRRGDELLGSPQDRLFSDPLGAYRFDGVVPGSYRVEYFAEAHMPEVLDEVSVRPAEETPVPPVHLAGGAELSGVVLRRAGRAPVQGARIILSTLEDTKPMPRPPASARGLWGRMDETDAEGSFRLGGLAPGRYMLNLRHEDFAVWSRAVRLAERGEGKPMEILLGSGGRVHVTVRGPEGQPLEGAPVALHPADPEGNARRRFGSNPHYEETGSDGTALLEKVPEGRWKVGASASIPGEGETVVDVREGETIEVELRRHGGAAITGLVTWRGEPVQKVSTWTRRIEDRRGFGLFEDGGRTSSEGATFETAPLPVGQWDLFVSGRLPSSDDATETRRISTTVTVDIPPGAKSVRKDVALPDRSLSGRVVRADTGEPVRGVRLRFIAPGVLPREYQTLYGMIGKGRTAGFHGDFGGTGIHDAVTDEAGSFECFLEEPGRYGLHAEVSESSTGLEGWRLQDPHEILVPEEGTPEPILVRLEPGSSIEGTVRDSEGRPVPGAQVRFLTPSDLESSRRDDLFSAPGTASAMGGPARRPSPDSWAGYTDSEGRYRLEGVEKVQGILSVGHRDYAPAWAADIRPGETPVRRDLGLEPGGALELRLPPDPADVEIRLRRPDLPFEITLTKTSDHGAYLKETLEGNWLLPKIPEGTWTIEAHIDGRSLRRVAEIHTGDRIVVDFAEGDE